MSGRKAANGLWPKLNVNLLMLRELHCKENMIEFILDEAL